MTAPRPNVLVRRRKRFIRPYTFRVLVIDLASAYDFPTQHEAVDFIAKHLPGSIADWRTA